jgi:hypothetical protein
MTGKALLVALLAGTLTILGAPAALGAGGPPMMAMGKTSAIRHAAFQSYYDGHRDTILNLDVSDKAEAAANHINYAPGLALVSLTTPEIYFVVGAAAPGQIAVLGSEPGEKDYSPVWREVHVSFKPGQSPIELKSDTQIDALAKKGVVTEKETAIRLNCPVIKVGKGS